MCQVCPSRPESDGTQVLRPLQTTTLLLQPCCLLQSAALMEEYLLWHQSAHMFWHRRWSSIPDVGWTVVGLAFVAGASGAAFNHFYTGDIDNQTKQKFTALVTFG